MRLKSIRREIKSVGALGAAVMVPLARHAEQVPENVQDVCLWPTMAIRDLTMVAADSALAADPLFHLGPGGHVSRIEVRYWYFRPELKYLTCQACAEGDGRSVVELEAVACLHRLATEGHTPGDAMEPIRATRERDPYQDEGGEA
jgi:hypothetical protein